MVYNPIGPDRIPLATTSVAGALSAADKTKLDGLSSDAATLQSHSASYFATAGHNHTGVYSPVGHSHGDATTSVSGFLSAADKTKLNTYPDNYSTVTALISSSAASLKIGGTGADGAFAPVSNVTITLPKNYTTINIPLGVVVTVNPGVEPGWIYASDSSNTAVQIFGTLSGNGGGCPGGSGGCFNVPGLTLDGYDGVGLNLDSVSTAGTKGQGNDAGGNRGAGGGGGAGAFSGTPGGAGVGTTGGLKGLNHPAVAYKSRYPMPFPGTGGGGGGVGYNPNSGVTVGSGGKGGAGVGIETPGTVTIGASGVLRSNGDPGTTTNYPDGSGGGGGGGGGIWVIRCRAYTNSGSTSFTGGVGAVGGAAPTSGGTGGDGGAGFLAVELLNL